MNTFVVYQGNSILFNRICENPPSLEDTTLISSFLEKSKFSSITYYIDVIHIDRHGQFHEHNKSISEFMSDFIKLCDGKFNFGVRLYLN